MENLIANKRAVFIGTARDCAWFLPAVFRNIEQLMVLYSESAVVIVENDSTDGTKEMLRTWLAEQPNGNLLEIDGLAVSEPKRTQRIATARNAGINFIRSSAFADWDHLVALDFDEVNSYPISLGSFENAVNFLEADPARAAVFANQMFHYYDIWALRKAGWCDVDCWKQVTNRSKLMSFSLAKIIYVFARQIAIPKSTKPVPVQSAFGGLGIYKMSYTAGCGYIGLESDKSEVCEHVRFNNQIRKNGGQLFIFPSLINHAPNEHLANAEEFGRRDWLVLGLIRLWKTIFPPRFG